MKIRKLGQQSLVPFFVLLTCGCNMVSRNIIEKPKVELKTVDVRDIGTAGATVVFGVLVENPNPFALKVDSVRYDVELSGKPFTSGEIKDGAQVPANDSGIVSIPVPVRYSDLFSGIFDFMSKGTSSYRVKGDASFGLFSIPFDQTGELNLKKK